LHIIIMFYLLPKTTWLSAPNHPTHLTWPLETFLCFPEWRYHHFDKTEVIQTELQGVLSSQKYDFQDTFNKWQKSWEWCICAGRDYFKGEGGK
jgi:hypothetical protein